LSFEVMVSGLVPTAQTFLTVALDKNKIVSWALCFWKFSQNGWLNPCSSDHFSR